MKKLLVLSILCLVFTGCGSKETRTDNVTVETETQVESEVIETETTTENETVESENQDGSNGTYATSQFESVEEIYCQYTLIEPITVYSKVYGSFYGDPNQFEGELGVWSAYEAGWEYVFDKTTTYEGVDYYATTFENGLIVIAQVTDFSIEPVEVEEESYFTNEETDSIYGGGTNVITPDMNGGDAGAMLDAVINGEGVDEDLLELWEGSELYKGGN